MQEIMTREEIFNELEGDIWVEDYWRDFVSDYFSGDNNVDDNIVDYVDTEVDRSTIYYTDLTDWLVEDDEAFEYMEAVVNNGLVSMDDYSFAQHVRSAIYEKMYEELSRCTRDEDSIKYATLCIAMYDLGKDENGYENIDKLGNDELRELLTFAENVAGKELCESYSYYYNKIKDKFNEILNKQQKGE